MIEPVPTKEGQEVLDAVLNRRYGRVPCRRSNVRAQFV